MKQRRKIIAGNWKMNKTPAEAAALAKEIRTALEAASPVAEVVLCPPFPSLPCVAAIVKDSGISLGAQNMHWEDGGAFTGEVSAPMLRDLGCSHVILGHSERRALFGETDATVNCKVKSAIASGLTPILCVGETLEQREAEETERLVRRQIAAGLEGLDGEGLSRVVIAYEPVWAIGTGRTATPGQAQQVHAWIRSALADAAGAEIAATVRIQYGGSMKPENAAELLSQPDIDGGLIGGAALQSDSFCAIIEAAD